MKQQTNGRGGKLNYSKHVVMPITSIGILADSWEVKEQFCRENVVYYEHALVSLNVFDHSNEIVAICKEIKRNKEELKRIADRRTPH